MEEYIVSALKYRPLTFDSVVGQRALTSTLKNAIETGKLAHAYLFCGPRGVGKTTCARIFARTINCLAPNAQGDPCGECESCKAFQEGRSMNIHELDAASNNSVEDIRELCRQVQIPPQVGRYKVFIIDEVHMLSTAAFNAFLKTLEEPPSYVIFILATTEKHKILPTILSRCQVYDFARMTIQGTIDHLQYVAEKEGHKADKEALALIAGKADGGMRDALSIFDQMVSFCNGNLTLEKVSECLGILSQEYYFRLIDHFLKKEVEPCLVLYNEILTKGYEGGAFISGLASHVRDLLVAADSTTLPLLETSESMKAKYQEQASKCKKNFLYRVIHLCNECDNSYRTARNKRLQVEICLIECAQIDPDAPYSGLRPRKSLKPFFQQPVAAERKSAENTQQHINNIHIVEGKTDKQTVVTPKPIVQKPKLFNLNNLGPSLRRNNNRAEEGTINELSEKNDNSPCQPLDQNALNVAWFSYINRMPREEIAMAERMKDMKPTVVDNNSFCITVNNEQVCNYMQQLRTHIVHYLSSQLNNNKITMNINVADAIELVRQLSKPELYKSMLADNKLMQKLTDNLKLVID